jgi:hypothetical protein
MAHLWHTRVRNALQPSQPGSTNDARNSRSRTFHAGSRRTHNPSVVGSSPTCPTHQFCCGRTVLRPSGHPEPSLSTRPGGAFVPHRECGVWNPPVVSLTETASIPFAQVKRLTHRPHPARNRPRAGTLWHIRGTARVESGGGTTTAVRADGPEDPSTDQNAD